MLTVLVLVLVCLWVVVWGWCWSVWGGGGGVSVSVGDVVVGSGVAGGPPTPNACLYMRVHRHMQSWLVACQGGQIGRRGLIYRLASRCTRGCLGLKYKVAHRETRMNKATMQEHSCDIPLLHAPLNCHTTK